MKSQALNFNFKQIVKYTLSTSYSKPLYLQPIFVSVFLYLGYPNRKPSLKLNVVCFLIPLLKTFCIMHRKKIISNCKKKNEDPLEN